MSIGNRIHYVLQKKIDAFIETLDNTKITYIYGGQTYRTLDERQQEHVDDNNKFKKMNIVEICRTKSPAQSQYAENYLINKLNDKFFIKCINDRNIDGTIAQRGGAGKTELPVIHKIYIMFK